MNKAYRKTIIACFIGFIVQAIIVNFAPLLFLTFNKGFGIPLKQITVLITISFLIQLCMDVLSVKFVDFIGYRASVLLAHGLSALGLLCMAVLPDIIGNAFVGLIIAMVLYSSGCGLLEVVLSPIVEACPADNKETAMSLLHSFYSWGQVVVILLSTLFFWVFGVEKWRILTLIWAVIPLANMFLFMRVPIGTLIPEGGEKTPVRKILKKGVFWAFILIMICAGAAEQVVSQWASTFAESALGVSKTVGDLAGPMFFAAMMGLARVLYGKKGAKIPVRVFMTGGAVLCIAAYLLISLAPVPILGLVGCGLCGLGIGVMWPGGYSMAAEKLPTGGTAVFALMALAGDVGCSGGPALVGFLSSAFQDNLKIGMLAAAIFPIILLIVLLLLRKERKA